MADPTQPGSKYFDLDPSLLGGMFQAISLSPCFFHIKKFKTNVA